MMTVLPILATLAAIALTVLAFIFIVPENRRARMNKFGQFLHDLLNFKFLIVEKILQAIYIFSTVLVVALGFLMLFYVQDLYYTTIWYGGYGILLMIFGPIVIRLCYEFIMMAILLIKNVIQINNKIKNQNEDGAKDVFGIPTIQKNQAPVSRFCQICGAKVDDGDFCTNCGSKL